MNCPNCNGSVRVIDTTSNKTEVIRRRKCINCNNIFHTSESIIDSSIGSPLIEKFKKQNNYRKGNPK